MIIDVDTIVGFWPRRRCDISVRRLQSVLSRHGVDQAWACSARGVWYDDEEGNRETAEVAARHSNLVPVATIDPRKWADPAPEVGRCLAAGFRAFRLFPDYQGWAADSPAFLMTLQRLDEAAAVILLGGTITPFLSRLKGLRSPVILTGAHVYQLADALACAADLPNVLLSTRLLIGPGSIEAAVACLGHERLVFGSHAPLAYQAAALRTLEAAELTVEQREAISWSNAQRLIGGLQ